MKKNGRISAKKIFSGAGVLAVCSIVAKFLGALFRVPLTNIVGAEGMGLYQMVFPLYTVLLTLTSGGLSGAISKLVAVQASKNDKRGQKRLISVALVSVLGVSGFASLMLILFRNNIASIQGNPKASLGYVAIAPAIVLVSLISCLKGFFQGQNNMLPSGISQLIEQLIKLVSGLGLASILLKYGVEYAVFGAILGITASEVVAFLYLLASYTFVRIKERRATILSAKRLMRLNMRQNNSEVALDFATEFFSAPEIVQKRGEVMRGLYKIALPITLGSLIMPLAQVIDSVMVINLLSHFGVDRADATALFGLINGPISSLINMPLVITLAFSVALLPKIAVKMDGILGKKRQDLSCDERAKINDLIRSGFKYVLVFSLPCAGVFLFFSNEVLQILYSSGLSDEQLILCSQLLKIESFSIIFVGLIQISTAILQGANFASRSAINLLLGAVSKVLLTLFLLPVLGIVGGAIASSCCYALTAILDIFAVKKVGKIKFLLMPIVATAVFVGLSWAILLILGQFIPHLYAFFTAILLGGICYATILLATKTISLSELLT